MILRWIENPYWQYLKTYLGRVVRDISRKIAENEQLEEQFKNVLDMAGRLLQQKKNDKNKLYSIHAPEVECIANGRELSILGSRHTQ